MSHAKLELIKSPYIIRGFRCDHCGQVSDPVGFKGCCSIREAMDHKSVINCACNPNGDDLSEGCQSEECEMGWVRE